MAIEPKTPRRKQPVKRKLNFNPVTPAKVRIIANKVIKANTEVKRHVSRNDFTLVHTVLAGYYFNYFNLLDVITIGTGQNLRIGQKIKLDHVNMSVLVQSEATYPLEFEIAILQLPYQATAYTYQQVYAAPTTGAVFNANGPITHLYNKDFVNRAIGYTKIKVDNSSSGESHSKWITKRVSLKQNFLFQDGSNYSQSGKDWYVVLRACSPGTGAAVATVGQACVTTQVMFTDS